MTCHCPRDILRRTIYPPSLVVIASIVLEVTEGKEGGGGGGWGAESGLEVRLLKTKFLSEDNLRVLPYYTIKVIYDESFIFQHSTEVTIATISAFFCFQTRLIFLKSSRKL